MSQNSPRAYRLKKLYGITLEDYETILKKQKQSCGVCGKHRQTFKTNLAVDHDHVTGEVRGALCFYCNRKVIGRHRNPDLFISAAKYLTGPHTGWFVPKKVKKKKRKKR